MNNSTKHLECHIIHNIDSGESNTYLVYVSELESEIRLLADLSMIVEMKMERIKDKYCTYE